MVTYLGNAFSLQMLDGDAVLRVRRISDEEASNLLRNGFTSVMGHENTARLASKLLGVIVPVNRISLKLKRGDILIVFQLITNRAPTKEFSDEEVNELIKNGQYVIYAVTIE
ncbi:MAG: STIV orfB116 family protein [Thermocladium sp.]